MKKSMKAALLSALVFPGLGHIYLKKYISGLLLAAISLSGIYYLITISVEKAWRIVEKIQSGSVPPDVNAINELLSKQSAGPESQLMNIATAVIVVCWIIGIIDSYRVGSALDKSQ